MSQNEPEVGTFIVFAIAGYHLALPIEAVLQVIKYPANHNSELDKMGLVQLGRHMIQLIDLNQWLGLGDLDQALKSQSFLVVIPSSEKKLYGILIQEPPNLIKFSLDTIQLLPCVNHQFRLLSIVSHAVVRNQNETPANVFLLDMQQVFSTVFSETVRLQDPKFGRFSEKELSYCPEPNYLEQGSDQSQDLNVESSPSSIPTALSPTS